MASLRILEAQNFNDTQYWAPTFKILAKTMQHILDVCSSHYSHSNKLPIKTRNSSLYFSNQKRAALT